MLILIIGLRACGKSTIGRRLAERWKWPFFDLDQATVERLGGQSVRDVWATHGEPAFRFAETEALRDSIEDARRTRQDGVIALGGGTPTAPGASAMILDAQGRGEVLVVYLRARPATLQERLRAEGGVDRPGLTGSDPIAEVPDVFLRRDPLYTRLADATIRVDAKSIDQVVDELAGLSGTQRD